MRMELDASGVGPIFLHRATPRGPVRYGDPAPDFKAISEKLDAAKKRLEVIAREVRNARRQ